VKAGGKWSASKGQVRESWVQVGCK